MRMRWSDLAFLHWQVPANHLRRFLPDSLELDTFEGHSWIGIVPFKMRAVANRWGLSCPSATNFLELNLRTYVRFGPYTGVWFFSLDASSQLAVWGARLTFRLPYFNARMALLESAAAIDFSSQRRHIGQSKAAFECCYSTHGQPITTSQRSLEHWLTERYCLFTERPDGRISVGHIQHPAWPLQKATVNVTRNDLGALIDLPIKTQPDHTLYAATLDVLAWSLESPNAGDTHAT